MADRKIFAGAVLRRLRRKQGMTQLAMAETLDISPSYLNLIERNQRPVSAAIILRLADRFDVDPRTFSDEQSGAQIAALRRVMADPLLADLDVDMTELEEFASGSPMLAQALVRMADSRGAAGASAGEGSDEPDAVRHVRTEIERWKNHFADLDAQAERLADELRLVSADLYGALTERLRAQHQLAIRILPVDVMPDRLRRLDLHARQLQLSELLSPTSRTFQAAFQLAQFEAKDEVDALVAGAGFSERAAERFFRRHLFGYFAAALMMPYARFLRACEATGYDMGLLQRRFGAGFEQVAHRLTTLHRVGARGLPFFMVRIDRAGQASKLYAGASDSPLVTGEKRCPLWNVHEAFARRGELLNDLVELEDGSRWRTLSRTVEGSASAVRQPALFVVAVGVEERLGAALTSVNWPTRAEPIGLGCTRCTRADCSQRSAPPQGRTLLFNERERTLNAFHFVAE